MTLKGELLESITRNNEGKSVNEELERIKQLAGISEAEIHDFGVARKSKERKLKQQELLQRAKFAYFTEATSMLAEAIEYMDSAHSIVRDAEEEIQLDFSEIDNEILRLSNEIGHLIEKMSSIPKKQ